MMVLSDYIDNDYPSMRFTIKISGNHFIVQGTILMPMVSNLCVSPVILVLYKGNQSAKLKVLYVKLPGATFPDEKQLPYSNKRLNKFLESYDWKCCPILGDCNCFFRALSYLIFWLEDYHQQIGYLLMYLNPDAFCKYCKEHEHVAYMKYDYYLGNRH